jgi:hypothetical protein
MAPVFPPGPFFDRGSNAAGMPDKPINRFEAAATAAQNRSFCEGRHPGPGSNGVRILAHSVSLAGRADRASTVRTADDRRSRNPPAIKLTTDDAVGLAAVDRIGFVLRNPGLLASPKNYLALPVR